MQITNAASSPRAILSLGIKLRPGEIATVDDDAWKKARKNKIVAAWLDDGEIKELKADEANKAKAKSEAAPAK